MPLEERMQEKSNGPTRVYDYATSKYPKALAELQAAYDSSTMPEHDELPQEDYRLLENLASLREEGSPITISSSKATTKLGYRDIPENERTNGIPYEQVQRFTGITYEATLLVNSLEEFTTDTLKEVLSTHGLNEPKPKSRKGNIYLTPDICTPQSTIRGNPGTKNATLTVTYRKQDSPRSYRLRVTPAIIKNV
jgi:hypothetical protein